MKQATPSLTDNQPENLSEDVRFTQNIVKKGLRNVASHHIESFDYVMQSACPASALICCPLK